MSAGDSTASVISRQLRITGRVQGVGYRWSMAQEAKRLGVNGWVRNRLDGSVEAVVSGPEGAVLAMIEWAKRGPHGSEVVRLEVSETQGVLPGFNQRETI